MDDKISVAAATAVGLGAIIGAGIFVLSGTAIALAGPDALIAFILVGILAIIIGFELGELGSIAPNVKGGVYSYVYKAFGSELGFITGILRYFSLATSISAITLGFGSYFTSLFGISNTLIIPLAILLIFILSILNIVGIKKAVKADFGLVVIKLGILAIFIVAAILFAVSSGSFSMTNFSIIQSKNNIGDIFAASIAVFFAYSGFQTISTFTSRVKGGANGAAKAIMYSIIISMVFYILVIVALIIMVPASKYTISADPLSFALRYIKAPAWLFVVVSVGALIATISATIAMILSASRTVYQISADKLLPKILRKYNKKSDVAINGVILSGVIAVIMLFSGNIYIIAAISNFGLMFSYLIGSFAIIHFRRNKVNSSFKTPLYPYLPIVAIIMLLAFIAGMPQEATTFGVIMIISLLVIYYFLREIDGKRIIRIHLFR
ncbi:MAG: APC family permease [Candidatus Marsarchaeota archaeon]|nr:APC family permease [Candidatus Marsarchaeota archaeon]